MMDPEEGSLSLSSSADVNGGTELQSLSGIRVITLDLDNTLWNTSATIAAANDALAIFLSDKDIVQSKRTETIMGELFQQDKQKYCPLAITEQQIQDIKAPVLLTDLRKDALQHILVQDNGYASEAAKEFADQAFQQVCTSVGGLAGSCSDFYYCIRQ
jgi:phosphoglycolate phosphatase-like HAD superfamily hydrolase